MASAASPRSERLDLALDLTLDAKPEPVRRVWIPKPGTDEHRPLGIPTLPDRALQALVKLALEPEWEARFEPNSYGFRPGRSCHDAIEAIFHGLQAEGPSTCSTPTSPSASIASTTTPCCASWTPSRRVRRHHQGLAEGRGPRRRHALPDRAGHAAGGAISPLLANIALHGLEELVRQRFPQPAGERAGTFLAPDRHPVRGRLRRPPPDREVVRRVSSGDRRNGCGRWGWN